MIRFTLILAAALLLPCIALTAEAPQADFYVAPDGSDDNPGTLAQPFATPAKARAPLPTDESAAIRSATPFPRRRAWIATAPRRRCARR